MRIRAALCAATLAFLPSVLPAPAAADPPPSQLERDAKRVADDARNAVNQANRDIKRAGQDAKKGLQAAEREISKAFREARDKLRTTRDDRRRDQRKELRDKWGPLLAKPRVQEELRIHFRRLAQLDYIVTLSDDLDMDKIQDRAEKARDLENERHDVRMATLKSKGGEE